MSFRPLAADALVFFTALGGASGYGGHTGGAFDMMPEDRSRGGACGCFKKCEAQDLQIFNRRVANTHTAIPQVSTSSTIDSNSPITFAQVLVHFQLFSDPIVCHRISCRCASRMPSSELAQRNSSRAQTGPRGWVKLLVAEVPTFFDEAGRRVATQYLFAVMVRWR